MAANLMYIKSRTLLPKPEQPPEEDTDEDDSALDDDEEMVDAEAIPDIPAPGKPSSQGDTSTDRADAGNKAHTLKPAPKQHDAAENTCSTESGRTETTHYNLSRKLPFARARGLDDPSTRVPLPKPSAAVEQSEADRGSPADS